MSETKNGPPISTLMRKDCNSLCWVVERSFAWLTGSRRLAKDDERSPETVARLHVNAHSTLLPERVVKLLLGHSP